MNIINSYYDFCILHILWYNLFFIVFIILQGKKFSLCFIIIFFFAPLVTLISRSATGHKDPQPSCTGVIVYMGLKMRKRQDNCINDLLW
jgi:hypothetical protein